MFAEDDEDDGNIVEALKAYYIEVHGKTPVLNRTESTVEVSTYCPPPLKKNTCLIIEAKSLPVIEKVPCYEIESPQKEFLKIDLTKDNDFERFIFEQPRSFVRVELDPVFLPQKRRFSLEDNEILSDGDYGSFKQKRRTIEMGDNLPMSPISPQFETREPSVPVTEEVHIIINSPQCEVRDEEIEVVEEPSLIRSVPPPRTPSPPPPRTPEPELTEMQLDSRPPSPSLSPSSHSFYTPPYCERRSSIESTPAPINDTVLNIEWHRNFRKKRRFAANKFRSDNDRSISPPINNPSNQFSFNKRQERPINRFATSKPGYPTYYERFLASLFSWDLDKAFNSSFGRDNEEVSLPEQFTWLENTMYNLRAYDFAFSDYLELKSTYIPLTLLNIYHDISKAYRDSKLSEKFGVGKENVNDCPVEVMNVSPFIRNDAREAPFLTQVEFKCSRKRGSPSPFSVGHLVMITTSSSSFKNLGVITEHDEWIGGSGVSSRHGRVVEHYAMLMKRGAANHSKLDRSRVLVRSIANIEQHLMETRAVYDFASLFKFSHPFVQPKCFNKGFCNIDLTALKLPYYPDWTNSEILENERQAIALAVNFALRPDSDWERILAMTTSASSHHRMRIFIEIVVLVLQAIQIEGGKVLIVMPSKSRSDAISSVLKHLPEARLQAVGLDDDSKYLKESWIRIVDNPDEYTCYKNMRDLWNKPQIVNEITDCLVDGKDMSIAAQAKLSEFAEVAADERLKEAHAVIAPLGDLLTQKQAMRLSKTELTSCLIFDEGFSDANVLSLCCLFPIASLFALGSTPSREPVQETKRNQKSFKPKSFIERFSSSNSTFTF